MTRTSLQNHLAFFFADIQGGGESLDQLHERCVSSLERIARKHKGSISLTMAFFCNTFQFSSMNLNA